MKKLLAILLATMAITLVGCSNNGDDEDDENWDDYAVNEVRDQVDPDEIEETTVDNAISTEPKETAPPYVPPNFKYNVTPDENKHEVLDLYEISIDGNMVEFPCKYSDIKDKFDLSMIADSKYAYNTEVDTSYLQHTIRLSADGKTGQGSVIFTFTPKNDDEYFTTIDNMICKAVLISTNIYTNGDNTKLMKFSLPGNITFGSPYNDLKDVYGFFDKSEMSLDGSCWNLIYTPVDDNAVSAIFEGMSDGLYSVSIYYK